MIGYLTGKIISKKPTQILLDVGGVGYLLNISINTFDKIPEINENVSLYTFLSVKEDSLTLYGFFTTSEKEMFEILIGINGVGPKLAQGVLSGITVNELKNAISEGNISRLVAVPGVGRKTAERMTIELRDKIDKVSGSESSLDSHTYTLKDDAVAALIGLGYNQKTADKIVRGVLEDKPSIVLEDLIKDSLKSLNK